MVIFELIVLIAEAVSAIIGKGSPPKKKEGAPLEERPEWMNRTTRQP